MLYSAARRCFKDKKRVVTCAKFQGFCNTIIAILIFLIAITDITIPIFLRRSDFCFFEFTACSWYMAFGSFKAGLRYLRQDHRVDVAFLFKSML